MLRDSGSGSGSGGDGAGKQPSKQSDSNTKKDLKAVKKALNKEKLQYYRTYTGGILREELNLKITGPMSREEFEEYKAKIKKDESDALADLCYGSVHQAHCRAPYVCFCWNCQLKNN